MYETPPPIVAGSTRYLTPSLHQYPFSHLNSFTGKEGATLMVEVGNAGNVDDDHDNNDCDDGGDDGG